MPIFGGEAVSTPYTTFEALIEKTWRRLMPAAKDPSVSLVDSVAEGAEQLKLSGANTGMLQEGSTLSVDMELYYVGSYNQQTQIANVLPGYVGSVAAAHDSGTPVYINPKFSRFDIAQAINDDLLDLSSPDNGLYRVPQAAEITYNPTFQGYDLGGLPLDFIDIIDIRYKIATPTHNFPPIRRWEVVRNIPDSTFPSGNGLIIKGEGGWPGLPMYVVYRAPFVPMNDLADDVVANAGLPATAIDIPPLGAAIALVLGREVKRNFTEYQPDPRKAPEVPPGAVLNSAKGWQALRMSRIAAEAGRLARQYPARHRGW